MAETPPEQLPPLQYAALQSRLPFESLTDQESALFTDALRPSANTAQVTKLLLYVRNRILQLWLENPKHQLLLDNAIKQLEAPYSQQMDRPIAQKMFAYLQRQGYINFGVFERIKVWSFTKGCSRSCTRLVQTMPFELCYSLLFYDSISASYKLTICNICLIML